MKNKFTFFIYALICGIVFSNCGGNSSNSNLKKNQYLGSLPSIYADYNAEKKAYEEKVEKEGEKLMAGGEKNSDKFMKLMKEEQEATKAMKEKFEASVKAEVQKLQGTEVPVSYSENLKNSNEQFYTISGVKLIDENGKLMMTFIISVKDDFEVPTYKGGDYSAYYRFYATDGSTLQKSVFMPIKTDTKPLSFTAGQVLLETKSQISMSNNPEPFTEFAGVEFISKDEYLTSK